MPCARSMIPGWPTSAAEEEQLRSQAVEAAERERRRLMEEAQQMADRAKAESTTDCPTGG